MPWLMVVIWRRNGAPNDLKHGIHIKVAITLSHLNKISPFSDVLL